MGLFNIILKLTFRRAFNLTVNGNTENSKFIEFTMYLLSFFVEIPKSVFIKFKLQSTISLFINYGVVPSTHTHIYKEVKSFQWSPKFEQLINEISYADHVKLIYFSLLHY